MYVNALRSGKMSCTVAMIDNRGVHGIEQSGC